MRRTPKIEGWLGYQQLMLAVDLGNQYLLDGPGAVDPAVERAASTWPARLTPLGLVELFLARAVRLGDGAEAGPASADRLLVALTRSGAQGEDLYAALVAADVLDVLDRAPLHQAAGDLVGGPTSITALVGRLARARLDRDPHAIAAAAARLERAGFVTAASRASADVVRLAPDDERLACLARRALVRLRRRWDGGPMWWIDDVPRLPSAHQVDVALRVAGLGGVRPVARELTLSRAGPSRTTCTASRTPSACPGRRASETPCGPRTSTELPARASTWHGFPLVSRHPHPSPLSSATVQMSTAAAPRTYRQGAPLGVAAARTAPAARISNTNWEASDAKDHPSRRQAGRSRTHRRADRYSRRVDRTERAGVGSAA